MASLGALQPPRPVVSIFQIFSVAVVAAWLAVVVVCAASGSESTNRARPMDRIMVGFSGWG